MNIAFFIPSLSNKGGVERSAANLINSLVKKNLNIYLITFKNEEFSFEIDEHVNIVTLDIHNYKSQYLLLVHRLRELIYQLDLDYFVTIETFSLLFSFIPVKTTLQSTKLVVWEHFNFKNNNGRKLRDFFRFLAAKYADLVITLTKRDADTWKKNLSINAKITYIYNIDPFEAIKPSYDVNSKRAIAIGRYVPVKGFDRLIKAWAIYERNYPDLGWNLDIIGYGQDKTKLENLIKRHKLKNVNLISDSEGIEDIYKSAGIYCMSSYQEGLSMVLIESQSFGIPAVAFDIYTGNSEILELGSGILVEDSDLVSFAEAIYNLASQPKLRLNMSCLAVKNKHRFSSDYIAERWIDEFKAIQ